MRRELMACTFVLCLAAGVAAKPAPSAAARPGEQRSLRSLFGVDAVRPLLRAEASETRRRAFERLGSLGTPRALELLARALDGDGAARDARERLAAVRALAPHTADPTAEDALIRALGGIEGRPDERALMVERTAALALAAAHQPSATLALARALRQPGRVSEHALLAFSAHPPKSALPLLEASGAPSPALVRLLGELGDARGRALVEKAALEGSAELRSEAAPALFRLDPARGLVLARTGFAHEPDGKVRAALTRVLARGDDPAAPRALELLLREPSTRSLALDLALELPLASFGPVLAIIPEGDDADRLLAALGRAGGPAALARLERALARPENAWSALYALALCPDGDAEGVLERALKRPALRRDAVRAVTLRTMARGESVDGVSAAVAILARGDGTDRAVVAWRHALLEPEASLDAFSSRDSALVRAVARAANGPSLARAAASRLVNEADPSVRAALAVALAVPEAADLVPTATLEELIATEGAAAYVAAYALAERDSATERPRLRELFASEDPVLRAHVALGLAQSSEASALGMLADAYRLEPEASVRRAIVRAIAARPGTLRRSTLALVAALEPDDEARALARSALGNATATQASPRGTAWLALAQGGSDPAFAVIEGQNGLALPFASDADGSVTVARLPAGPVTLSLARAAPGRVPKSGGKP
jgi:hypothetical protein